MSDSVRFHRWQPTRLRHPWDSPGKNTGVGCHFLLHCMKVKSESAVVQSCLTLSNPMDCSPPGSSVHGIFQIRVLEWGAIAFSKQHSIIFQILVNTIILYLKEFCGEVDIIIKDHLDNPELEGEPPLPRANICSLSTRRGLNCLIYFQKTITHKTYYGPL